MRTATSEWIYTKRTLIRTDFQQFVCEREHEQESGVGVCVLERLHECCTDTAIAATAAAAAAAIGAVVNGEPNFA